jgi:hypothetical protein
MAALVTLFFALAALANLALSGTSPRAESRKPAILVEKRAPLGANGAAMYIPVVASTCRIRASSFTPKSALRLTERQADLGALGPRFRRRYLLLLTLPNLSERLQI